jgi:hypothetical protein
MKTVGALVAAGLVFCAVAIREWNYRAGHPYALGPSGYIVALGVGGAIVAFVLAAYVYRSNEEREHMERLVWGRMQELQAALDETEAGGEPQRPAL